MHFDDISFIKKSQEYVIVLSDGNVLYALHDGIKMFLDYIKVLEKDGYAYGRPYGSQDIYVRIKCTASDAEMYCILKEIEEIVAKYSCKCTIVPIE